MVNNTPSRSGRFVDGIRFYRIPVYSPECVRVRRSLYFFRSKFELFKAGLLLIVFFAPFSESVRPWRRGNKTGAEWVVRP